MDKDAKYEETRRERRITNGSVFPPFYSRLSSTTKLPALENEGEIQYPFEDTTGTGDENKIRGNWSSKADFILSCVGFSVGFSTIWRFPYYCYINGGGAFLIPYFVLLILAGMPLFVIELSIGQFASLSCVSVWKVCPLFKGVGIAMFIVSCLMAIYYNMIMAWSIFYLISSFRSHVPWSTCDNPWNTKNCTVFSQSLNASCIAKNGTLVRNGTCVTPFDIGPELFANFTPDLPQTSSWPSEEFFERHVLEMSGSLTSIGKIHWQLALYLLLAWILVFFCLFKGIKSSGKVVYVTAVAPYLIFLVLLVHGLTLDGSLQGILYFVTPDWSKLLNPKIWGDAAVQVFYTLATCWGGLMTLASYNRFHNDCFKDAWWIMVVNAISSVFIGCVVFSTLGFVAYELNTDISRVAVKDMGLAFVVYAEAIARLPVAPVWSILFFVLIIMLGIDTQFFLLETVITSICDEFPERLRKNHRHVLSLCALIFYACGIPLCTQAGMYMLQLMDSFVASWSLLIIGFFECMALSWVYGVDNLLDNIKWMIGYYPPPYIFWKLVWKFLTPLMIMGILLFTWYDFDSTRFGVGPYPSWAITIGWIVSFLPTAAIPVTAIVLFALAKGGCVERYRYLMSPQDDWGPALAIHRAEQYPLQIPEAREPTKFAWMADRTKYNIRDDLEEETLKLNLLNNELPHFDRETAI